MNLPFTVEQFIETFASYNNAVWPIQIVLNLLALAAIVLAIKRFPFSNRMISGILSLLWLWTGVVYHISFFARINPVAYGFGALCVMQGALFAWLAVRDQIEYHASMSWKGVIGGVLLLYGLVIYPIIGHMLGHVFPGNPTFGAPCPTTIFTFGILLWGTGVPRYVSIIPALWSLIGFSAAISLGIREDIGLLVAGLVGTSILIVTGRRSDTASVG